MTVWQELLSNAVFLAIGLLLEYLIDVWRDRRRNGNGNNHNHPHHPHRSS